MRINRSIKLQVALAMAAGLVAGCGSGVSEADLVGNWKGKIGMTYKAMQQDAAGETDQAQMYADQMMQGEGIALTLQSDGTAELTMKREVQGTWTLDGSIVTLVLDQDQVEQMLGQAAQGRQVENTYRFEVTEGGKRMEAPDPNVEGLTLKFDKGS